MRNRATKLDVSYKNGTLLTSLIHLSNAIRGKMIFILDVANKKAIKAKVRDITITPLEVLDEYSLTLVFFKETALCIESKLEDNTLNTIEIEKLDKSFEIKFENNNHFEIDIIRIQQYSKLSLLVSIIDAPPSK